MAFPLGRMGLVELRQKAGLAKSTFYDNHRTDPEWIRRMDLRKDRHGRLHVCANAAEQFIRESLGELAFGPSGRADPLLRRCPFCDELIRPLAKVCRHCGRDVPPPDGAKCATA